MMGAASTPAAAWRGLLRHDEPLARHTVWGIGGPAELFYEPADLEDLCRFVADQDPREPLCWLGLGSNVLVRDGGIRGTVIHTAGCLKVLRREGADGVYAEAGVACAKLAKFCARHQLGGCEFMAGIPGTVGGALAMNAGAFGGETYAVATRVLTLGRDGVCHWRPGSAFNPGYRHVELPPGEWFLAAEFSLAAQPQADTAERIRALLRKRAATQPTGLRSCGSVFRNPPGDHAARLIEACGLKGRRVGAAQISEKHANFIINTGNASAADVEALIGLAIEHVEAAHGVRLRPEVCILGDPA